jgi:hypothetical protein
MMTTFATESRSRLFWGRAVDLPKLNRVQLGPAELVPLGFSAKRKGLRFEMHPALRKIIKEE